MKARLIVIFLALGLGGCASMDKSECQQADWRLIGQVDASKGRHYSVLNEYRQDCARHGITPDHSSYNAGYDVGLLQFCTRASGFYQGKQGYKYRGICPPEQESKFLQGYHPGFELFMLQDAVTTLRSDISRQAWEIRELEEKIREKEQQMIHEGTSAATRSQLLDEIKSLHRDIFRLQQDMDESNLRLQIKEQAWEHKRKQHTQDR